ncbi:M28 family peptidase, partial [Rubrivirga sp.]|uniref:M28 family peptidase n=1 Tax=Rubrivirga sp. TaxID=1885344 RepID=UPI003C733801
MKYLAVLLVAVACGCASTTPVIPQTTEPPTRVGDARLAATVRFLASDEMLGRRAGTPEAEIAARYIAEQFRAAGVQPVPGAEDGYFQVVPLPDGGTSRNVLGLVTGSDPALRDEVVVLTAHYDGLGASMGQRGATAADSVFNGARDNGMGVAALIAAARDLAESPPARSVLLFAPAAEELGLVGSRYYVENPLVPLRETVFVLNTDGAGYSDTSVIGLIGQDRTGVGSLVEAGAAAAGLG